MVNVSSPELAIKQFVEKASNSLKNAKENLQLDQVTIKHTSKTQNYIQNFIIPLKQFSKSIQQFELSICPSKLNEDKGNGCKEIIYELLRSIKVIENLFTEDLHDIEQIIKSHEAKTVFLTQIHEKTNSMYLDINNVLLQTVDENIIESARSVRDIIDSYSKTFITILKTNHNLRGITI